jgi:hypothetical protein
MTIRNRLLKAETSAAQHGAGSDAASGPKIGAILKVRNRSIAQPIYSAAQLSARPLGG